jgi:hypothetical protein
VVAGRANLDSEPAVASVCHDNARGKHRFLIALPFGHWQESTFVVNGIRVVNGVANDAIAGSGKPLVRLPGLTVPYPSLPAVSGAYHSLGGHPRVFTTAADLEDLVSRINRPGSYSMQRFGQLAAQIKRDLASHVDWDVAYSGCDPGVYLYAFSYEPQDGHDAEIKAALKLGPASTAPAGAAVVASRLALYAALVKAGAAPPAGTPSPDQVAALAKRILLA